MEGGGFLQVSDRAFCNTWLISRLISREGIRWVLDNPVTCVERLWGGNYQMEEGVLMDRSRNDKGKMLHMKLVKR